MAKTTLSERSLSRTVVELGLNLGLLWKTPFEDQLSRAGRRVYLGLNVARKHYKDADKFCL